MPIDPSLRGSNMLTGTTCGWSNVMESNEDDFAGWRESAQRPPGEIHSRQLTALTVIDEGWR